MLTNKEQIVACAPKGVLSLLLLLCLLDMPYGYYAFTRFVAMAAFLYFAYREHGRDNAGLMWLYVALAVLFQPLWKVSLGRTLWNVVDVAVAAWLLVSCFLRHRADTGSEEGDQ